MCADPEAALFVGLEEEQRIANCRRRNRWMALEASVVYV
jgi:hypothetical protein